MREGLYKGRRTSDGAWVEGFLIAYKGEAYIIEPEECEWSLDGHYFDGSVEKVVPETVCEYSGLPDKDGVKIFEGDMIIHPIGTFIVKWDGGAFLASGLDIRHLTYLSSLHSQCEVIGSIYDGMVFEKSASSVSRKLTRNPIGEEKPQPLTLEEANKVFKKNYVDVMNAAMVESSLLKNVSAMGALSKLNQDRLDALAAVVGTSFFKGDRK